MASGTISFEEFVEKLRDEVPASIQKANEKVESDLPDIIYVKRRNMQRSQLLDPKAAQAQLKGLIEKQNKIERFLDVVTALRGGRVEITEVSPGHRDDGRDVHVKAMRDGVYVDDMRVLLGQPEKRGRDIGNEISQAAFYKVLKLHVYNEKANIPNLQLAV